MEVDCHQKVNQQDRKDHTHAQPRERAPHGIHLAAHVDGDTARQAGFRFVDDPRDVGRERAEVALVRARIDVENRLDIVMILDGG